MKNDLKVCVIGMGYIGLPTAALLANRGYTVHGVDVVQSVVDTINSGKVHIIEPELDTFVTSAVSSGRLKANLKPVEADIFIIAVPTPFKNQYEPDISYVVSATNSIAPFVKPGCIVILESTSPVGTTEAVRDVLQKHGVNTAEVNIAYCPERVLPGKTMQELVENDRIVGGITPDAAAKVKAFYKTFVQGEVLVTEARTAEMAKLTENSYRDVNIAFANEISMLCDKMNINPWELIRLANRHPRVNILQPGCGVGGHCIAIDPWFIVYDNEKEAKIIKGARERNLAKTQWVIDKIKSSVEKFKKETGKEPKVACMGLAFKPDIDDLRESPAIGIAKELKNSISNLLLVEPNITEYKDWTITDHKKAFNDADIVVFLVGHKEFKEMKPINNSKIILDFCGITSL
jgi:UDP-N-acetyl-D-mannosaminuronic acid dehydrogenase